MNFQNRPPVCFILGAGDCPLEAPKLQKHDLLICADGGYASALRLGLTPALLIGDFDSLKEPAAEVERIVRLPIDKDITDTEAALLEGERMGYRSFVLLGCTGGRPDHTLAAEQLLVGAAARGLRVFLVGASYTAFALYRESVAFSRHARGTVSVFAAFGEARGVSLRGLRYPLAGATLSPLVPLGVSNSFPESAPSEISVSEGALLVYTGSENLPFCSFGQPIHNGSGL